jgi:lipopolysaccharide heptosyltransferase II
MPAALFCYLTDIPLRLAHCRENPYQLLTDWVREAEPTRLVRHEVCRQLDLVAAIGCQTDTTRLSFRVPDGARAGTVERLSTLGLDQARPWIVVHPGASAPSRRYPPEAFAEAADILADVDGMQILFTGRTDEMDLIERVQTAMNAPSFSLAGQLGPGELGALLELAPLLIAKNTGPVHIAAAVGTPVVELYALTNPQHTPWAVPHRVLSHHVACKYCYKSICPEGHHDCLRRIPPADVVAAARSLLHENLQEPEPVTIEEKAPCTPWASMPLSMIRPPV